MIRKNNLTRRFIFTEDFKLIRALVACVYDVIEKILNVI
jgi:hypothetical protein